MLARSAAAAGRGEPVDLDALAADCITDLHARAHELDLRVRDHLEPAWTRGEPALLERMIANLLDNAIRYNVHGGFVDVHARQQGPVAMVSVINGGPVIATADAQALTEPFRRLDRGRSGFGLGLSIVRSVVEAHHGTLSVAARPEGGLEVRIELPSTSRRAGPAVPKKTPRALTKS